MAPADAAERPKRPMRIFHGPHNIGGAGHRLATMQRGSGHVADAVSWITHHRYTNEHVSLGFEHLRYVRQQLVRLSLFTFCVANYDVFTFYYGKTLLPFGIDLPILRLLRKTIVMVYCGSDVRLVEVEARRNPYADLLRTGPNRPDHDARKRRMMRWHRLWVHRAVAPRNLAAHVAEVFPRDRIVSDLWLHNPVPVEADELPSLVNLLPVIVHAPTEPEIKGSAYVDEAVAELRRRGHAVEYVRLEGVRQEEVVRVCRERADIVVDQLLLGAFGTLAVEAMSFGKPVCGYLVEEVRASEFPDCPIVNVTIESLPDELERLIGSPELREDLGRRGREFVARHFEPHDINERLLTLYRELRR